MRNTFLFYGIVYRDMLLSYCTLVTKVTQRNDFRVATMKMLRRYSPTNYGNLVHLS